MQDLYWLGSANYISKCSATFNLFVHQILKKIHCCHQLIVINLGIIINFILSMKSQVMQ